MRTAKKNSKKPKLRATTLKLAAILDRLPASAFRRSLGTWEWLVNEINNTSGCDAAWHAHIGGKIVNAFLMLSMLRPETVLRICDAIDRGILNNTLLDKRQGNYLFAVLPTRYNIPAKSHKALEGVCEYASLLPKDHLQVLAERLRQRVKPASTTAETRDDDDDDSGYDGWLPDPSPKRS